MTTGVGTTLTMGYDGLRRLTSVSGGPVTRQYTYRDIDSTKTTLQVASVTSGGQKYSYTYDSTGNIATFSAPGKGTVTYTYDNQGQLLKAAGDTTYTYTYDGAGNILTASNGTTSHTYTYGDVDWKDLLTAFDGSSITYDAIGNPTSYYNGTRWNFSWENGRSLATASDGTNSLSFAYDADGLRTSKTVNGTTYRYYYAGGKLLRMTWGANTIDFFYDANGTPYALKYNGTAYYYVTNLQGDVMRIVNASGTVMASYDYDPYGKVISATGTLANVNPLRYRGYVYDTETGFYYVSSRYYDPEIGRWINADSIIVGVGGNVKGYNLFAFCFNNPINMDDQTGNWPQWIKNTVKWVAKNIVKPVVKTIQKTLSKIDLTYSAGFNVSGTPKAWIFNGQIGVSMDTKGNVAIQTSCGGGVTGGDPSISITYYQSITNAPNIDKLNGAYYQIGGSIAARIEGVPVAAGGDVMFMPDTELNTGYFGLTGNVGFGTPGKEFHTEWGTTVTLPNTQFNVYEVARSVYIKIMEW